LCDLTHLLRKPAPAAALLVSLASGAMGPVRQVAVGEVGPRNCRVVLGLAAGSLAVSGRLDGSLAMGGAPPMPISAVASVSGSGLSFPLIYADIPEAALRAVEKDPVPYRIEGTLHGQRIAWSGALPRSAVRLDASAASVRSEFVRVSDLSVSRIGFAGATVNVDARVFNPFRFDLKFAAVRYRVEIEGETVGAGHLDRFLLHGERWSRLTLPVELDGAAWIAAAGQAALSGGAEGRLAGTVTVRLPDGNLEAPFELPIRIGAGS
jgi:Late embryogenesis abundant protein